MTQTRESTQQELIRRHRLTVMAMVVAFGLTLALMIIGYLHKFPLIPFSPSVAQALWVAIAMCGFGSIALRRTKFSTIRLNDIAALRGMSGLLASLQNTTLLLVATGVAIVVMGFITTMMRNEWIHIRNAGVIAICLLLYSYPSRTSWQRVVQGIERKGIAEPLAGEGK